MFQTGVIVSLIVQIVIIATVIFVFTYPAMVMRRFAAQQRDGLVRAEEQTRLQREILEAVQSLLVEQREIRRLLQERAKSN